MRTDVLVSKPLNPLADRMRELAGHSREFWIATAFLTTDAVDDLVGAAIRQDAKVRLLTGTFGNNTRKTTFARLLAMQRDGNVETRIWDTGGHRRFHTKLYIWRLRTKRDVAWIGSSNFTAGGLQQEGELMLEMRGPIGSRTIDQLRRAFNVEWSRGAPLDKAFVDNYVEAPRPAPDARALPTKLTTSRRLRTHGAPGRNFVAHTYRHMGERRAEELTALLRGTASHADWFITPSKSLSNARVGDRGLLVDVLDREAELVEVIDAVRVGERRLVAYQPVFARTRPLSWTLAVARRAGASIGVSPKKYGLRDRKLTRGRFEALVAALYGPRKLPK